jgi:hypothetical protein
MSIKIVYKWAQGVCTAMAEVKGRPEINAEGKTIGEAIGNLVQAHPKLFLVNIEEDSGSASAAA